MEPTTQPELSEGAKARLAQRRKDRKPANSYERWLNRWNTDRTRLDCLTPFFGQFDGGPDAPVETAPWRGED